MATFIRLVDYPTAEEKERALLRSDNRYHANQRDFEKIPGSPVAYWVKHLDFFYNQKIGELYLSGGRLKTHGNDKFLRKFWEINKDSIENDFFKFIENGGDYRKWYGNKTDIVDFRPNAIEHYRDHGGMPSSKFIGKPGITWGMVTSEKASYRYKLCNSTYSSGAPTIFPYNFNILCYLNSKVAEYLLELLNPTLNTPIGEIGKLPVVNNTFNTIDKNQLSISKSDWDLRETSWDFRRSPLITDYAAPRIETVIDENLTDWSWPSAFRPGEGINLPAQVESFKRHWTELFLQLHRNEEENNRIFIELYGLQEELTPDVPYTEITILQDELVDAARKEQRIEFDESVLARQFVSYGVGCLMGRYSVEKDGLILADAGATVDDFIAKVPGARFLPDQDAILPLTDEDDFADDLPTRFKEWLRFLSGQYYEENLSWLESKIGRDIRSYFLKDFYKEHVRRYKNRPIYWMVSSPSGCFRALVYLHRYTRDTVSKVLNDYLRPYREKLVQKIRSMDHMLDADASISQNEKARTLKRKAQLEKYLAEIDRWERDVLYPLTQQRIELDLDDGVKVNYRKLSSILEPVKQLEEKEE